MELCCKCQFHGWGDATQCHLGAFVVVRPEPARRGLLHRCDRVKERLREPVVAHRPMIAFDVGVRLRLARLKDQPLAVEVVQNVEEPEAATVGQLIVHEVHRPHLVGLVRHGQRLWRRPHELRPQLDPEVEFERPIHAVHPWASTYSFFNRRCSSSSSFMRGISDTSRPPNFDRHLEKVALLMPCVRQGSGTGVPAAAAFRTARIWLSVNREVFMGTSSGQCTRKFHLWRPLFPGGITAPPQRVNTT